MSLGTGAFLKPDSSYGSPLSPVFDGYFTRNSTIVPGSARAYVEYHVESDSYDFTLYFRTRTEKFATKDGSRKHRVDINIPHSDAFDTLENVDECLVFLLKNAARDVIRDDYANLEAGRGALSTSVYKPSRTGR